MKQQTNKGHKEKYCADIVTLDLHLFSTDFIHQYYCYLLDQEFPSGLPEMLHMSDRHSTLWTVNMRDFSTYSWISFLISAHLLGGHVLVLTEHEFLLVGISRYSDFFLKGFILVNKEKSAYVLSGEKIA